MKPLHLIAALLCSMACLSSCRQQTAVISPLVVCGDDQVLIISPAHPDQEENRVIWQWKVAEAASQLPQKYQRLMIPLDECKSVDKDSKLLLTSSGGGALLLNKATKECLFYADVPMAHSAELLPGHKIAIALSTHPRGNSLELYDIRHPERRLFRDSLYSGHGVVWMAKEERLYALGHDELRSYKLELLPNDSATLHLDKAWTLPTPNGHELSQTDTHELLVSTYEHVYLFNTRKGTFSPFSPLANTKDVKSANFDKKANRLIYTKAETSWWTNRVYIHHKNKQSAIPVDSIHVYKVRTTRSAK